MAWFDELLRTLGVGLERFLLIVVIIAGTVVLQRIVHAALKRYLNRSSSFIKVDPTHYNFLRHLITAIIYISGIAFAASMIPGFKTLAVSLLAGAGILAVIIGFASQAAFANIVSGIFIVIFKPFRVGDTISIGVDVIGKVEDVTLRHTVIRSFQNKRIIIPNSVISNETIENASFVEEKVCKFVEFGISYDSDITKAKRIMRIEAQKHPLCLDNRSDEEKAHKKPKVTVRVIGLGDSSVNLRAWVWAKNNADGFVAACDLYESIKLRFDKEGIEIPFPHRTVVMKGLKKPRKRSVKKKLARSAPKVREYL